MPDFPRHVLENLRQIKRRLQALLPEIENAPNLKKETEEVKKAIKTITEIQIKGLPVTRILRNRKK
ncbi:MAG: hypothetical protein CMP21_04165 [Rickettsiales bacterium]|nr:hypothetical protein [Rickettsiales bacterium]|tara:strand:- start:330 stop:527 length:198 start_codon:yes stop_codon:yes gene_type:complete